MVDTQGEYRWWLDQDTFYDGHDMNINKRGYLMGIRETPRGTFTAVQGQHWYEFDMMGQILPIINCRAGSWMRLMNPSKP